MGRKGKNFRIRSGARTTSKTQEKELIKKAKALQKDPDLVLPECKGECFRCPFKKVRKNLYRIQDNSDSEKFLENRSNKGDPISRAYAATLTLVHTKKAPFLARLKTPFGEVGYMFRGKAKREKLIGVQYYDHPQWRLFSVLDIVKKKKLNIYSAKDKMYCTGKVPNPPKQFVLDTVKALKVDLKKHGKMFHCKHISPHDIKDLNPTTVPYILIDWNSAGVTLAACQNCVASKQEYMMGTLTRFIAAKEVKHDFDVTVISKPICKSKCKDCLIEETVETDPDLVDDYKRGEMIDIGLIEKHTEDMKEAYRQAKRKIFITEGYCYGSDEEAFITALNPSLEEERAIRVILNNLTEPVFMEKATTSRFFSEFWETHKKEVLMEIAKDKKYVKRILEDKTKDLSPNQMIREAKIHYNIKNILSKLPDFKNLSPVARFADEVGREYLAKGDEEAERYIERTRGTSIKKNKVAAAFLFALNREGKKWQFTKEEGEFGEHIKPIAKQFLESNPKTYAKNLQKLIKATGSTEKIEFA